MAENAESSLVKEIVFVLGENNAELRESRKSRDDLKKVTEDLGKIAHRANNLKQAELEGLQDKKMCFKVLDRVADLIEKKPAIIYIILIGLFAKIGVDIYGMIKAVVESIKIG